MIEMNINCCSWFLVDIRMEDLPLIYLCQLFNFFSNSLETADCYLVTGFVFMAHLTNFDLHFDNLVLVLALLVLILALCGSDCAVCISAFI